MRRHVLFGVCALVAAVFSVVPASAAGGSTVCNGSLAPGAYYHVVVPTDGLASSSRVVWKSTPCCWASIRVSVQPLR